MLASPPAAKQIAASKKAGAGQVFSKSQSGGKEQQL
jgi:hypothetical protein